MIPSPDLDIRSSEGKQRLLQVLGLPSSEADAYVHLLAGELSLVELASLTGLAESRTRKVVGSLARKGLVRRLPERMNRYGATPPHLILPTLVRRREMLLQETDTLVQALIAEHRQAADPEIYAEQYVEVIVGIDALQNQFEELQSSAEWEILGCTTLPLILTSVTGSNPGQEVALAKGVRNRWLYEAAYFEQPGGLDDVRRFAEAGEEARSLPSLPSKMFIVDRRIAFVHATERGAEGTDPVGLVMRYPELVRTLRAFFEQLWSQATPVFFKGRGSRSAVGDMEAEKILQCLVTGMKDAAICRELGISRRTLARRIQTLLASTNARSRFQAAFMLGRQAGPPERL